VEARDREAVVSGDRLRGLGGALDRARVDRGNREPGHPLAQCLGLRATLLGEVDSGGPAREQRTGLRRHGVAHQPEGRPRGGGGGVCVVRPPIVPGPSVPQMSEHPLSLSASGPPETILDPEPPEALVALQHALAQAPDARRDALASVAARWPTFLDAWAQLG